ncbi:hypothetical protein [Pedobacter hartonius]|uniref:Uncharacterized protein n=1 Tax=Pedobacter hartonius TaxID=425514 RepID=A0A1H4H7T3_9SPHI|nr:hypothetical protein [Pedobacter hartonius]SEB17893.1 hypothetical protein SAMN05443550_11432 [Pedobacter hartonius]
MTPEEAEKGKQEVLSRLASSDILSINDLNNSGEAMDELDMASLRLYTKLDILPKEVKDKPKK